jgi:NADH dehydrogenase [ubiquinone] 1 alpha subcomplex assembly factor 3
MENCSQRLPDATKHISTVNILCFRSGSRQRSLKFSFLSNKRFRTLTSDAEIEYQRTTITRLREQDGVAMQITGYNQNGFYINDKIAAIGPIVIFPKSIYSWNIEDEKEITEKSLSIFPMIEPKPDILIIGYGSKTNKIDPEIPKWLIKNKIKNFEILPTEQAVSTFNFVVAESRFVAAALIPDQSQIGPDLNTQALFDNAKLYGTEKLTTANDKTFEKLKKQAESLKLAQKEDDLQQNKNDKKK